MTTLRSGIQFPSTIDKPYYQAAQEGKEIMERQAAQDALSQKTEEMRHMAYSDMLTGLPNRMQLNERLGAEMEKTRRGESSGAVLFVDLDDLKMINDTFGHTRIKVVGSIM